LFSEEVKNAFDKLNCKGIVFLGSVGFYSFGIYLIHCYVLLAYRIAVKKTLHVSLNGYLQWACLTSIVFMISYALLWGMKKLFPRLTRVCLGV
jgi:peptidoglycan/LPS O-acetylase OafA/YrhL